MKSERGDLEIQSALVSGPGHFGEITEKPEKLEKSTVFNEKREGGPRNVLALSPDCPGFRDPPSRFSLKTMDLSIFSGFS